MGPLSRPMNHSVAFKEVTIKKIKEEYRTSDPLVFCCHVILSNKEQKQLYLDQDQLDEFHKNKKLTLDRQEYRTAKIFRDRIYDLSSSDEAGIIFEFEDEDLK